MNKQDQDAIVEVIVHTQGRGYYDQGGNVTTEDFTDEVLFENTGKYFEYTDFSSNPHIGSDKPYYGKKYLLIGSGE